LPETILLEIFRAQGCFQYGQKLWGKFSAFTEAW